MALITCPECGAQISDKAEKCPKCGMPLIQNTNKTRHNPKSNPKRWKFIVGIVSSSAIIATIIICILFRGQSNADDMPKDNKVNGHEYVDLGLSSGMLWATCNIGANSPEAYGDYFAWGETTSKNYYSKDNYKFTDGNGFSESPITLPANYDAASTCWGNGWRMPTCNDFHELVNDCQWEWTTLCGNNGYKITGPNGNHIFLPTGGLKEHYMYCESDSRQIGTYGYYWSSSICNNSTENPCVLMFHSEYYDVYNTCLYTSRENGCTIRPVYKQENK